MQDPEAYREKAMRFRELACDADQPTAAALMALAESFEEMARQAESDRENSAP